jgi:hypothetical protein
MVLLYKVPNRAGFIRLNYLENLKLEVALKIMLLLVQITISPDVLSLCHSKVLFFQNFTSDNFLAGEVSEFKLNHFSQKRQFALKTIRHS